MTIQIILKVLRFREQQLSWLLCVKAAVFVVFRAIINFIRWRNQVKRPTVRKHHLLSLRRRLLLVLVLFCFILVDWRSNSRLSRFIIRPIVNASFRHITPTLKILLLLDGYLVIGSILSATIDCGFVYVHRLVVGIVIVLQDTLESHVLHGSLLVVIPDPFLVLNDCNRHERLVTLSLQYGGLRRW